VVGNAGWLIKRKRFDVFLRTAKKIQAVLPNACFVICGDGPEEQSLRELAIELGIASVVRFEGWISDLSDYYRAFDVLLFNSDFDTLPCAPMEAASYGCPTVASLQYGGLSEFIVHGMNGFLFTDHDTEALAKAILALANDESFAKRLRCAARQRLQTHFSPKAGARFYQLFFGGIHSIHENREHF
jgi:glycosyltransferase involved in cell wall biosynthesis